MRKRRTCRGCRRPYHMLRLGLCPACDRERAERAAAAALEEARGRALPPTGTFADPLPPGDLFSDDE